MTNGILWIRQPAERYLKSSLICFCRLPTAFQCQLPKYNQCSYPLCPQCRITMVREYQRFCDRCVQQLDWSKFEDAKEVYIGWDGVNKAYLPRVYHRLENKSALYVFCISFKYVLTFFINAIWFGKLQDAAFLPPANGSGFFL